MRRSHLRAGLVVVSALCALGTGQRARAQEPTPASEPSPPGSETSEESSGEPSVPGDEPTPPGEEPTAPGSEPTAPGEEPAAPAAPSGALGSISWRDIVTVPRRPILKYHRVELIPTYNVSLNSPILRHHSFGGIINFFLSETLNLGLEGSYHQHQTLEHYFLRGLDDRVLPSANRYLWSASVNFGYVPVYGKFALFNKWIFQWEIWIQAGLGVLQSEWIPRDPANQGTTNFDVLWHVDIGYRLFLTKWLVVHAYLKDYMFIDKFEPASRMSTMVPPESTFESRFVQNIVFGVGVGMFLPTGFEYKYTR